MLLRRASRSGPCYDRRVAPISLAIDEARRILIATGTGDLSVAEIRTFIATGAPASMRTGRCSSTPATLAARPPLPEVSSLAAQVGTVFRYSGPRGPVAIVAVDPALFGIMRMYQMLCENRGSTRFMSAAR